MPDVLVTVPMAEWESWLLEGDLPGERWTGAEHHFHLAGAVPLIEPGERVYVVAWRRVRGYAPLVRWEPGRVWGPGTSASAGYSLVRRGGAVACTIPQPVRGFRGWRYRFWRREDEVPFPAWRTEGVGVPR